MKSKKKVLALGVLNGTLFGEGNSLFNFFKGGNLRKKFGKPWYKVRYGPGLAKSIMFSV